MNLIPKKIHIYSLNSLTRDSLDSHTHTQKNNKILIRTAAYSIRIDGWMDAQMVGCTYIFRVEMNANSGAGNVIKLQSIA